MSKGSHTVPPDGRRRTQTVSGVTGSPVSCDCVTSRGSEKLSYPITWMGWGIDGLNELDGAESTRSVTTGRHQ